MAQSIHVTQQPVVLEGFQAVMKPSKFGYSLATIIDSGLVEKLEEDRVESLKWAESKLKNPKRSTLKPEPWEEVAEGKYKVKFSWNEETKPPVVDSEGTPVTDENTPLYSGSKVKLAFRQKPYILKDGITYGTSLKLVGIQVITVNGTAGVDTGDLDEVEVAAIFGQTKGYKTSEPNVTPKVTEEIDEDDMEF
ncbi:ssDNA binding protein [Synechococcus phage S-CBP3]|uniref:SsDNA binding protein n=2 Tax=Synechococcus phage S-CBP3 TaxID=756276 RepID=A0A096VKK2_9CAUD|nr:Gp2.5-like ssDNA binding protein and ssDNA annealing protein [Synechococcus phage S-CBP3]YP_009822246.1 Gp2.5-like ssDNA binding protein and ssDNA annealing protein [Synechococcus phage S-CBP3]AFK66465.1 ssDNA binding protein [Synechococcus phage S-CBP3]AGK86585.1 ssDNA binding protein [Synechococcus phage S-CBP3]